MRTPFIVVTLDSKVIERKRLDKGEITIGRAQENDIVIDNLAVSRRHAKIFTSFWKGSKVVIKDLGSANGTFVNGLRVDEAELKNGDMILVGKHILKFYEEGAPKPEESLVFRGERGTVMVDAKTQEKFLEKLQSERFSKAPRLILSNGKEIEIKDDSFTIGSGDNPNLKIEGLFVKSPHAKILKRTDGAHRIVSMGSFIRPTKVNGTTVKEKVLRDGDIIKIGKHEMIFAISHETKQ